MIIESEFKPAWWLSNAHAQTIYSSMHHPLIPTIDKTEKLDLPDGDFIDLAWSTNNLAPDSPLVIILHGLGGGLQSSYVARFMNAFNKQGWRAVLMHFRGAGKEYNRLPRAYHSGDTADLDFFVNLLNQREPHTKKAVVGVSLGGNVLLKWLGEKHIRSIDAAIAVSVPFELKKVADRVNEGFSRLYQRHLLGELKTFFAERNAYFKNAPEPFKKAKDCTCFWTFDNEVTAPLYGFNSAHHYYRECSSRQFLRHIQVPTLILQAEDDPFMTADILPKDEELASLVTLELSKKGGHVGFVGGSMIGSPIYWLDQRIPEFITQQF
ncbi:hydrolase [Legionella sp. km772]|uniref:hydrolase n=1 Tax=Legionella sp. km772 TaxID=2498111 RepID=UPI000F8E10C8|nr:hydrolase [Legionella sp. km772]RUR08810.1 hydrolase [Legionella sp. km772]